MEWYRTVKYVTNLKVYIMDIQPERMILLTGTIKPLTYEN
jgi:hypothetical protein